jgi:hypothetical protein
LVQDTVPEGGELEMKHCLQCDLVLGAAAFLQSKAKQSKAKQSKAAAHITLHAGGQCGADYGKCGSSQCCSEYGYW